MLRCSCHAIILTTPWHPLARSAPHGSARNGAASNPVGGSACRNTWGTRHHRSAKGRASAAGAVTRATQVAWRCNTCAKRSGEVIGGDAHKCGLPTRRMQSALSVLSSQRGNDVNRPLWRPCGPSRRYLCRFCRFSTWGREPDPCYFCRFWRFWRWCQRIPADSAGFHAGKARASRHAGSSQCPLRRSLRGYSCRSCRISRWRLK
jgi:hypothetical protein